MDKQLIRVGLVLVAVLLTALFACSCGASMELGYGHDPWFGDVFLEDGDRRGNYIYYNGSWHYRGFGTPYYWYY